MKRFTSRRVFVFALCVAVTVLFLVRLPAAPLRQKVLRSIASALGRNVDAASLHLRFLPRPGFELQDLVIHDDPAFGAEPLLRAPEVTAWLQVAALLRGRIEIASLSLSEPSLNLARNASGSLNIADLVQRTSSITVAPTASRRAASPEFPYIEGSDARVNFKNGMEKTHFALTDAKFSLWQDSENSWGLRLQARPIRTDTNLTDTGILNIKASWQRSATLENTPINISFQWKQAQIGQISRLMYGSDQGWRGGALLSGEASGTLGNLKLTADGSIDDFRAREVLAGNDLRLAAHCSANYEAARSSVSDLDCIAPSGGGLLELRGSASSEQGSTLRFSNYNLRLIGTDVPVQSLLVSIRHARDEFAANLNASGTADLTVGVFRANGGMPRIQGGGELHGLQLDSKDDGTGLTLGTVPFALAYEDLKRTPEIAQATRDSRRVHLKRVAVAAGQVAVPRLQMQVGPFDLPMGRPKPLKVSASLSREGYHISVTGDGAVKRLLQAARSSGVAKPSFAADGGATLALDIAGGWYSENPVVSGTAQLHTIITQLRGVNGSLTITRAKLDFEKDWVKVENLTASLADAVWHGSLRISRPCRSARECELRFDLRTAKLSASALNQSFNPDLQKKSWYRFLSDVGGPGYLTQAHAIGRIAADQFTLGNVTCSQFSAGLESNQGRLSISGLKGEILGGEIFGDWEGNFNARPPEYKGEGDIHGISLGQVSELMHDGWAEGSADARYQFSASGRRLHEALASAEANVDFSITGAAFPHVVLTTDSGPLRARAFSGSLQLHQGEISFQDAKLETSRRVYSLSGIAALSGALDLKIAGEGTTGYTLTGTILHTSVSQNPATAASLKP